MPINTLFYTLVFSLISLLTSFAGVSADTAKSKYERHSVSIYPELLKIRKDLFDHPEASGEEKRTSKVVADYLADLGLEVRSNLGGYGVVGILKGAKPGKRVMWRADMDAARYVTGDPDQSDNELAHVCGHDVHTTIGLGLANALYMNKENLSGTVYFLFQPAEESQKGALAMIDDGLFDLIQIDEVYAAHIGPSATGVISTRPGNVFAHSRYIQLEFAKSVDTEKLSQFLGSQMEILTRLKEPERFFDMHSATIDSTIGIASQDTIYQNYILFGGAPSLRNHKDNITISMELYTAEHSDIANVVLAMQESINGGEFAGYFKSLRVAHEREGVDNDPGLVGQTNEMLKKSFGANAIEEYIGQVPFASEDFGHFQKYAPGVYFFIGASNPDKGIVSFPHMPDFAVDEKVIELGVTRFATLLHTRLESK